MNVGYLMQCISYYSGKRIWRWYIALVYALWMPDIVKEKMPYSCHWLCLLFEICTHTKIKLVIILKNHSSIIWIQMYSQRILWNCSYCRFQCTLSWHCQWSRAHITLSCLCMPLLTIYQFVSKFNKSIILGYIIGYFENDSGQQHIWYSRC